MPSTNCFAVLWWLEGCLPVVSAQGPCTSLIMPRRPLHLNKKHLKIAGPSPTCCRRDAPLVQHLCRHQQHGDFLHQRTAVSEPTSCTQAFILRVLWSTQVCQQRAGFVRNEERRTCGSSSTNLAPKRCTPLLRA